MDIEGYDAAAKITALLNVLMDARITPAQVKRTGIENITVKDIKDAEKLRVTYDALINEVLQEREEAVRIAQAYKAELDRIEISDDDIEHLHNTVSRVLEIIKTIQLAGAIGKSEAEIEKIKSQVEGYAQIKE